MPNALKKQKPFSRTFNVCAEDCDGYDTVTVVFGHPIDANRVKVLDREIKCALQIYYGPDSTIEVAR